MPVTAATTNVVPTLKYGDRGNAVYSLERALARLGYLPRNSYSTDKYFGTLTRTALRRFQAAKKLPVTGRYNAATRAALQKTLAFRLNQPGAPLALNDRGDNVKKLEGKLATLGLLAPAYAKDGYFGTVTRDALKKLQAKHDLAVTGTNTAATRHTIARLISRIPKYATATEPAHNYGRVYYQGALVNVRTRDMMLRAQRYLNAMGVKWTLKLTQGSYNPGGVAASAGTHDGGGALDVSVRGANGRYLPYSTVAKAVKAMRMAGFAAWSRGYSDGTSFSPHIHAIAIGDRQLSSGARSQVRDYFAGRNGLANHASDRDRAAGRPYPRWATKYR